MLWRSPRLTPLLPVLVRSTAAFLLTPQHSLASQSRLFSANSKAQTTPLAMTTATPPMADREDDRVVWVGAAPEGWKADVPRQSEGSKEALVDPPVGIPDPYGWLRDEKRTNQKVLDHLNAENAYTEAVTAHLGELREKLYQEMLASIQETDYTTPRPHGDWWYYTRTFAGKSYTTHVRAPKTELLDVQWDGAAEAPILNGEQIVLDVNELAKGQSYCATGSVTKSPSHQLLAYAADFSGDETCSMYVKDLSTGEIIDHDEKLEISGSIRWGSDNQTLFYLKMDDAHRPFQVYRRTLDNVGEDEMLYEENDELYWTGISKSLDGKYLFIESSSKETSEIHYLDLTDKDAKLQCVAPRRSKVLYDVEHLNGNWWITSNVGGLADLALWKAPAVPNSADQWELVQANGETLFAGSPDRALSAITCLKGHVVCEGREGGLPRIWVATLGDESSVSKFDRLEFAEEAYDVGLGAHYEADTDRIVVAYDSLVTPPQSLQIALDTDERQVVKQKKVPGYDASLYSCERTAVKARDGTDIPVSLVYRKDVMERHQSNGEPVHVHLYGYGSYGSCVEADFSSTRLCLLERNVVYVLAHIRGGGEMGRPWYEEPNGAKYLCKKNTFTDFVDVGQWLVEDRKLTTPSKMSCEGRSAGGLLIGASLNLRPDLFRCAILGVPFVDVLCTMVDATIPLTVVEWEEWGNPNEEKFHQYMKEYCPMQNVAEGETFPSCLLTGGLHDPRVQFWEPTKFAATLRHAKKSARDGGSNPICVKMDMSAGHFSASDRYKYLKELAFDYAFMLGQVQKD